MKIELFSAHQVNQILRRISLIKTTDFAGIGIVFYNDLGKVPHIDMGHPTLTRPKLPITEIGEIISTLASAADISSPWHDGFHFICSEEVSLTHLSQFIAPSLTMYDAIPLCDRPSGARHMTAALVSNSLGIDCVGLVTGNGEISVFRNGAVENKETIECI